MYTANKICAATLNKALSISNPPSKANLQYKTRTFTVGQIVTWNGKSNKKLNAQYYKKNLSKNVKKFQYRIIYLFIGVTEKMSSYYKPETTFLTSNNVSNVSK